MKTTFRAKLIFETDKKDDIDKFPSNNEFTYLYMIQAINEGKIIIEAIADMWDSQVGEPVIIIKEKNDI